MTLSHNATTTETFEGINQVFFDGIIENMASFVQPGKYGATNTTYSTTMVYYVINFVSEDYTLHEDNNCDGQIYTADKLFVKAQYLSCMKENTKWYWKKKHDKPIIVTTHTILHLCLDVMVVKYFHYIPISVCNRNQAKQALQRHPICLNDYYHNYIIKEIGRRDKI